MATLNVAQALASGGLRASPNTSTGLTSPSGNAVAVPTVSKGPTLNVASAIGSGGLTQTQGVQGASTKAPAPTTPAPTGASRADASNIANSIGASSFLDTGALDRIYQQYRDNSSGLASAIENEARANAERSYQDTLTALQGQKTEVNTLAGEQKAAVDRQVTSGLQDLTDKQTTETNDINKQTDQFKTDVAGQQEQLAKQWRDMSLETQSIMRGSGRDSSSYAAGKETQLLGDFNQGLRVLSQKSTDTLAQFASAIDETTKFYTRAKADLQQKGQDEMQSIDDWVRQRVSDIQNQEKVALSDKLREISGALLQAQQLKSQTESKILDQQLGIQTWLAQTQAQYKMAVASAAQGKVASAQQGIKDTQSLVDLTASILKNNGEIVKTKDGTYAIHGYVPSADGTYQEATVPVTAGFVQNQVTQQAGSLSKINPGLTGNDLMTTAANSLGLSSAPYSAQQSTDTSQPWYSSITNAIGSMFGK